MSQKEPWTRQDREEKSAGRGASHDPFLWVSRDHLHVFISFIHTAQGSAVMTYRVEQQ